MSFVHSAVVTNDEFINNVGKFSNLVLNYYYCVYAITKRIKLLVTYNESYKVTYLALINNVVNR